jgi:hypothetical protein
MPHRHTSRHAPQRPHQPTRSHWPADAEPWCDPAVRVLRRGQPPPTGWRPGVRRELRFWGYLAFAALLATLIPITATLGADVANSTAFRLVVACAIPVVTGLTLAASGAPTGAAPKTSRRDRQRVADRFQH